MTCVLIAASFLQAYLILPRSHADIQDSDLEVNVYMKHGNLPQGSVGEDSTCNAGDLSLIPGVVKTPWRRDRLPTPVFLGFPCGPAGKECACNAGDLGSIPGLGRSSGEGKGYPLQYSGLENSIDYIAHRVAKSRTQLSAFHFHFNCFFSYSISMLPFRSYSSSSPF